jgi:hypothetical protein
MAQPLSSDMEDDFSPEWQPNTSQEHTIGMQITSIPCRAFQSPSGFGPRLNLTVQRSFPSTQQHHFSPPTSFVSSDNEQETLLSVPFSSPTLSNDPQCSVGELPNPTSPRVWSGQAIPTTIGLCGQSELFGDRRLINQQSPSIPSLPPLSPLPIGRHAANVEQLVQHHGTAYPASQATTLPPFDTVQCNGPRARNEAPGPSSHQTIEKRSRKKLANARDDLKATVQAYDFPGKQKTDMRGGADVMLRAKELIE